MHLTGTLFFLPLAHTLCLLPFTNTCILRTPIELTNIMVLIEGFPAQYNTENNNLLIHFSLKKMTASLQNAR
jgi:hypothetical protein